MNHVALVHLLLMGIGVAALPAGVLALRPVKPDAVPPGRPAPLAVRDGPKPLTPSLDSLARAASARAPFRLSRRPAGVAYDPDHAAALLVGPQPAASKPPLSLSGIAWGGGVRPMAVLEGLPGGQGARAVRLGEQVEGLTMRRIQPDVVIVTGFDTTWTLRVRAPWK